MERKQGEVFNDGDVKLKVGGHAGEVYVITKMKRMCINNKKNN